MSADRINYVGSALAALDQALNTDAMLSRNDAAARVQAFATLAVADELRKLREFLQQRPAWPAADIAAHAAQNREGHP